MNIQELLQKSLEKLKKTSPTPQLDAELLLGFVLKKPREYILIHPEYQLTKTQETRYEKIIKRRLKHEPIAYILGEKEFYGLNFKVTKDTLIPRPETESLVELALYSMKHETYNKKNTTIIDIGTGSGNIIISLAKKIESENLLHASCFMLYGIDISQKALTIAKYNAKKNNVDDKIKFIESDLLKYFLDHCSLITDHCIIIANLPYLSKKIYSSCATSVKKFEPKSALLSGIDGLDHYEKLFQQIIKIQDTRYKIQIILEISPEQKQKIEKLIKKYFPLAKIEFQKDLAQKWRVVIFEI